MPAIAMNRDNTVKADRVGVRIRTQTGCGVWAFGNQRLRMEADIPGEPEMCEQLPDQTRLAKPSRLNGLRNELFPERITFLEFDEGDYSYCQWGVLPP